MKHGGKMLGILAGSLAACIAATATTTDGSGNPYQSIVERNVFGLKPPAPPPDPEANKPPLPKITLTGIVTLGGTKRALMKTPPEPAKPGVPAKTDQGFTLAVGERQGEIEVLAIDETARSVKVNYGGTVTDLDFDKDGVKTPPTPAPAAPAPPGFVPPTKTVMAVPGAPGGVPPAPGFPARALRTPGSYGGAVTPQGAVEGGTAAMSAGGVPLAFSGSGTTANPSATAQPVVQRTAEEGYLLLEAARLRHADEIKAGRYPPLPRHPMADLVNEDSGAGTPAPVTTPQVPRLPLPPGGAQPLPQ